MTEERKSPEQLKFEAGMERRIGLLTASILIDVSDMPRDRDELNDLVANGIRAGIGIGLALGGLMREHDGPEVANKLAI